MLRYVYIVGKYQIQSQTCSERPPLEKRKSGLLRKVTS
jgi:hypothetical protein